MGRVFLFIALLATVVSARPFQVSKNRRFFETADGKPFFWLADTAWLLAVKCSRPDVVKYLDTRRRQGFNVAQIMLLHDMKKARNFYGDDALVGGDASKPNVTPGGDFTKPEEYDYWDHVEFIVDAAAKRGITAALVPVWGSNVKGGLVDESQAKAYAEFLAKRFGAKPNIVWLNGGDLRGDDHREVWRMLGATLKARDPKHLVTFHPRGRTMSSEFFHNESWLDFNMFQSGHRNYAQDNSKDEKYHFGEDNWRYLEIEYALTPVKPTLDGEPSYENIPQGLHNPKDPRWTAADMRRYAYWSVFAGGAGFTYGENSVMQFYVAGAPDPAYGAERSWTETIASPGAEQMRHLKSLMLSKPYFERVPANAMVIDQGTRYDRVAATAGKSYAFFYTYTGRNFTIDTSPFKSRRLKYSWFDPRTGRRTAIGSFSNERKRTFDPPGEAGNGNDWVLVVEASNAG